MIDIQYYEAAKEMLNYDPNTGIFIWKEHRGGTACKGSRSGSVDITTGYERISISINGKRKTLYSHRLAWFFTHGELPEEIDHINHDRACNKIENLRACSLVENRRNKSSFKGSSSKYLGVCWASREKKWLAQIKRNDKHSFLGYYENEKEAASMYNLAAMELFGEFANLNDLRNDEPKSKLRIIRPTERGEVNDVESLGDLIARLSK